MDFSKWDRIYMTTEQCFALSDIIDTIDMNAIENGTHAMGMYDTYPLHRFCLTTENGLKDMKKDDPSVFHHFFTMAGDHLDIRSLIEHRGEIRESWTFSVDMINFKLKKKEGVAAEKLDKQIGIGTCTYWQWLVLEFMLINTYILSDPEKIVDVEEREVFTKDIDKEKSGHRSKRQKPHKVRLVRSYRLKKRWKTALKKRIQEITCPAWGVRGHYRHYKDGRVIFIQPYVKGKKRDEYLGKVYDLLA